MNIARPILIQNTIFLVVFVPKPNQRDLRHLSLLPWRQSYSMRLFHINCVYYCYYDKATELNGVFSTVTMTTTLR